MRHRVIVGLADANRSRRYITEELGPGEIGVMWRDARIDVTPKGESRTCHLGRGYQGPNSPGQYEIFKAICPHHVMDCCRVAVFKGLA
jgi:hypothetical protein